MATLPIFFVRSLPILLLLGTFCFSPFVQAEFLKSRQQGFGFGIPQAEQDQVHPSSGNCTESFFEQKVDHFSYTSNATFLQRYFIYDQFWTKRSSGENGPIFFYVGNEADVTLYVNASGLMWENAPNFGALLVFAEHRFYGKSQPFKDLNNNNQLGYLSSEQALADYAVLLNHLKTTLKCPESPVIGFGGSYGGMLGTWMRMKYPHVLDGVIAASAPIWHFLGDTPSPDPYAYASIITRAASKEGGATDTCKENVRATWEPFFSLGKTVEGRGKVSRSFRLCSELQSENEVNAFALWIQDAWSSMAMGNYPFASSYLLNGEANLPAWPIRVACSFLDFAISEGAVDELFDAHRLAIGVFYNTTGDQSCFDWQYAANDENEYVNNHWDYQYCTEMFMPMGTNGVTDMFWANQFDLESEIQRCFSKWGVKPRTTWAWTQYGGHDIASTTNILFSNGFLDPWSGTGVLQSITKDLPAIIIKDGAHHLDLMFSTPDDPESVIEARHLEVNAIQKWINLAYQKQQRILTDDNFRDGIITMM